MQRGIGKKKEGERTNHGSTCVQKKKKQKRLEKLKSFTRFSAYPIETTSIKDFIYRNKGNFQPASTVSLKFRGFIFLLGLLSPSLLFFSTPFPSQLNSPFHPLDRGVCVAIQKWKTKKKKKKKRRGWNKREQFENNLQSISLFLFSCAFACVFEIENKI